MQAEVKGYIHAKIRSYKPDEPEFDFSQCKSQEFLNSEHATYVMVMPYTLSVDIGDFKADYRKARIEALRKEDTKVLADCAKRRAEIKDEISKLQAITFDAEVVS